MEDEITYGVLMRKIQITDSNCVFIPVHLVKGIMIADCIFADTLGKDYTVFTPGKDLGNKVCIDDEYFIGYTATEKELMDAYPEDDLENAEMYFYEAVKDYCIFNQMDYETGVYKFAYIEVNNLIDEYVRVLQNSRMKQENSGITKDNSKEAKYIGIAKEEVDSLLKLVNNKDYDKLIERLKQYKDLLIQKEDTEEEKKEVEEKQEKAVSSTQNNEEDEYGIDKIDVNEFFNNAKKRIIGQDEALKDIIIAAKMDQYANSPAEKNRCFIIGPTGTGKTEMVNCLGKYLDKPVIKVDTTQITVPGYVGGTLEEVLAKLVNVAGGDIKKAENGIITFDEIDKKCGNTDKLFGQGFLYTLLPFLDGTDYTINVGGKKQTFNTSNLTIFASGSFSEIIKNTSLDKKTLGFNAKSISEQSPYLNPDEIFKRAAMPEELIGRFPVVIQLNSHTEESLSKILTDSENSHLKSARRKFNYLGVNLNWEDKYIKAVAKEAIRLNVGARSLKKIVEQSVRNLTWEVATHPNKYTSATLLGETVSNPKKYILK